MRFCYRYFILFILIVFGIFVIRFVYVKNFFLHSKKIKNSYINLKDFSNLKNTFKRYEFFYNLNITIRIYLENLSQNVLC